MNILGISSFYHDAAAAIIKDGELIAAAQEERFTRKKHDPAFPVNAIRYCLDYAGLSIDEMDAVVFYDKPMIKFERLLETYYSFAPKGIRSFFSSMPVWIREKLFLKKMLRDGLEEVMPYDRKKLKLLFPEHHLSHAASAFYPSPFEDAAILTIDGVGEWATVSICHGKGKDISILKELRFPNSLGLLYSAFTYYTGFRVNSGEYKLMGLAPYGNHGSERVKEYVSKIYSHLIEVKEDGSLWLDQDYFDYATGLKMTNEKKWEALFGLPRRKPESEISQPYCDMALAIQQVTEEIVIKMATEAKRLSGSDYLCMAGGVALNCVANGKLLRTGIFKDIYFQPASGDAGGSLGAALAAFHIYFGKERVVTTGLDDMKGSYLGPEFFSNDIDKVCRKFNAVAKKYDDFSALCKDVAGYINEGNAIGWMQGRMEFGPRALGARSILGDARNPEMQKKLNVKIKYRESFRPFAPSVLAEDAKEYFALRGHSPYMLIVEEVQESRRKPLPANYGDLDLKDKLYFLRSDIPAITHIDYSARVQTVHKETNPRYWQLINAFKALTGYSVVVNTSFNVRGEPIVCMPEDGYKCFMRTEMDYLVMGDYVFSKSEQPEWKEDKEWQLEYVLD
jgi:carbamoyltransferase